MQPYILSDEWGSILLEWENGKMQCKDTVILPNKAMEWDWGWDRNDVMHHQPGIRIKDLDYFLDYTML